MTIVLKSLITILNKDIKAIIVSNKVIIVTKILTNKNFFASLKYHHNHMILWNSKKIEIKIDKANETLSLAIFCIDN